VALVARQRLNRGWVQRQLPRLAELSFADRQHACVEVDVVAVQAERLGDPHAGNREQPDHRPVQHRSALGPQRGRLSEQPTDLLVGVQIRDRVGLAVQQQPGRRDLRRWLDRAEIDGKASDHRQPRRFPALGAPGVTRPLERQLGSDRRSAGAL